MAGQPIYTIGYGSRTIEALTEIIRECEIHYLIDVRSRPYSSFKPEFSKQALEGYLKEENVGYLYMGDTLGGLPADPECYIDGKVDYERLSKKQFYQQGIKRLVDASEQGLSVVLMCSEEKPERCHRSKLIGRSLDERSISVIHIDENNLEIDQDDAIRRVTGGQPSLFGDDFHNFTSRKRYELNEEDPAAGEEEDA
jgi:uncharacterized protein (DUF488 family)